MKMKSNSRLGCRTPVWAGVGYSLVFRQLCVKVHTFHSYQFQTLVYDGRSELVSRELQSQEERRSILRHSRHLEGYKVRYPTTWYLGMHRD